VRNRASDEAPVLAVFTGVSRQHFHSERSRPSLRQPRQPQTNELNSQSSCETEGGMLEFCLLVGSSLVPEGNFLCGSKRLKDQYSSTDASVYRYIWQPPNISHSAYRLSIVSKLDVLSCIRNLCCRELRSVRGMSLPWHRPPGQVSRSIL
jgi:hypothetical protein